MSALTNPRGPLPQRVYWLRRAVVLGAAFVLVFGAARLLGGGGDGSDGADVAARTGSDTSQRTAPPADQQSAGPTAPSSPDGPRRGGQGGASAGPTTEPPAEPDGECDPAQVAVEPVVWRPTGEGPVRIGLDVSTTEKPACYWDISSESMTLAITSGDDDIWSTRQCPTAVPDRRAVVRSTDPARVVVEWSGQRSDEECSDATSWALPGYYHVEAAAMSGEPADAQFQLEAPSAPEITRSPEPTREPGPGAGGGQGGNGQGGNGQGGNGQGGNGGPGRSPSPSGAVEPDGE